jgi:copper chaperone
MEHAIEAENIKCGGCANTIVSALKRDPRVQDVSVEIAGGRVVVCAPDEARADIVKMLAGLGYPEKGSVEGLRSVTAKAMSFASCAVGRLK